MPHPSLRAERSNPSIRLCRYGLLRSARNDDVAGIGATKEHDGQIKKPVQSSRKKYSAFAVGQISGLTPRVSPKKRGVAQRHERWDAVDAEAATDERGRCGRRSRVVLAPRCWRQVGGKYPADDGGKKAGHRGERDISRKPLRGEGRSVSAEPVCSCAFSFVHVAHETAGAARTRSSLRPLRFTRVERDAKLGRIAPREGGRISASLFDIRIGSLPPRRPCESRDPYRVVPSIERDG